MILNSLFICADDTDDPTESATDNAICAGCFNLIDDEEFVQALGQQWHTECFR